MTLRVSIEKTGISALSTDGIRNDTAKAIEKLRSGQMPMTEWVSAPLHTDEAELGRILEVAEAVKAKAELMVVIGIGGSYMGARAAIEALPKKFDGIDVKFAGINFCGAYHRDLIEEISRRETVVCVISKSGNTLESRVAFDVLKDVLIKKYGRDEAAARIIAVTDANKGALREEADREGYVSFAIPENTGGRYSAMTAVGLLPMAVAGIDIRELLDGAAAMAGSDVWESTGTEYAAARYLLMNSGKAIEAVAFFDSRLTFFGEWIKQLYGESEGKEGKGLFPVSLNFSTDLHSIGQFLQEGSPVFFETMVIVDEYDDDLVISSGGLAGRSFEELNSAVVTGAVEAHRKAGTPVVEIHLPKLNAYYFGQLMYFLQMTCAVTAMLMGVNPFDQPGVEVYKQEMRKELDNIKKIL